MSTIAMSLPALLPLSQNVCSASDRSPASTSPPAMLKIPHSATATTTLGLVVAVTASRPRTRSNISQTSVSPSTCHSSRSSSSGDSLLAATAGAAASSTNHSQLPGHATTTSSANSSPHSGSTSFSVTAKHPKGGSSSSSSSSRNIGRRQEEVVAEAMLQLHQSPPDSVSSSVCSSNDGKPSSEEEEEEADATVVTSKSQSNHGESQTVRRRAVRAGKHVPAPGSGADDWRPSQPTSAPALHNHRQQQQQQLQQRHTQPTTTATHHHHHHQQQQQAQQRADFAATRAPAMPIYSEDDSSDLEESDDEIPPLTNNPAHAEVVQQAIVAIKKKRNRRERLRWRKIRRGFAQLREKLPRGEFEELSQLSTLRRATRYIFYLMTLDRTGVENEEMAATVCEDMEEVTVPPRTAAAPSSKSRPAVVMADPVAAAAAAAAAAGAMPAMSPMPTVHPTHKMTAHRPPCAMCKSSRDFEDDLLLCCSVCCAVGIHQRCHLPPVTDVSVEWKCQSCRLQCSGCGGRAKRVPCPNCSAKARKSHRTRSGSDKAITSVLSSTFPALGGKDNRHSSHVVPYGIPQAPVPSAMPAQPTAMMKMHHPAQGQPSMIPLLFPGAPIQVFPMPYPQATAHPQVVGNMPPPHLPTPELGQSEAPPASVPGHVSPGRWPSSPPSSTPDLERMAEKRPAPRSHSQSPSHSPDADQGKLLNIDRMDAAQMIKVFDHFYNNTVDKLADAAEAQHGTNVQDSTVVLKLRERSSAGVHPAVPAKFIAPHSSPAPAHTFTKSGDEARVGRRSKSPWQHQGQDSVERIGVKRMRSRSPLVGSGQSTSTASSHRGNNSTGTTVAGSLPSRGHQRGNSNRESSRAIEQQQQRQPAPAVATQQHGPSASLHGQLPAFKRAAVFPQCAACGNISQFFCSVCQRTSYCSRQCQEKTWRIFCASCIQPAPALSYCTYQAPKAAAPHHHPIIAK